MKGFYEENGNRYPEYPELGATVAKSRKKARALGSVMNMTREDRRAYADAVESAIRAKHRAMHVKPFSPETGGRYSPPPISRLLRYDTPIKMKGDPDWTESCDCPFLYPCRCDRWRMREMAVYSSMMREKGEK